MTDGDETKQAKALLDAELKRRNMGYPELAQRLTELGLLETKNEIIDRISRGGFSAAFFVQCMEAAGAPTIHLDY